MASKTKKIVLFIVEGATEESALNRVLKNVFQNDLVRFQVVRGDLTADRGTDSKNAVKIVNEKIRDNMNRYRYRKSDILRIVHLIDTDGAFIPGDCVEFGYVERPLYEDERIITAKVQDMLERNKRKSSILRRLSQVKEIAGSSYSIYYFSRNMEHVLHDNIGALSLDEKIKLADRFNDTYRNDKGAFIDLLSGSDFTVTGDYKETWQFIFSGTNSLHRNSNLHLLFPETE